MTAAGAMPPRGSEGGVVLSASALRQITELLELATDPDWTVPRRTVREALDLLEAAPYTEQDVRECVAAAIEAERDLPENLEPSDGPCEHDTSQCHVAARYTAYTFAASTARHAQVRRA